MIPPAIVLGLAMTHILGGFGRIVHRLAGHGQSIRLDWIHLTWVTHIFIWMVFFWWYSYAWTEQFEWSVLVFIFLIFYTITLYLICVILMPSDLDEVVDFENYFVSLRKWFFGGIILLICIDFADSAVKGWDNLAELGAGYFSLRSFLLVGAVAAMWVTNRLYQGIFSLTGLIWTFLFFWLNRPVIGIA